MYIGLKHLHSFTAYLTLLFMLIATFYSIYGWLGKKHHNKSSKNISLSALIATHIQVVFGIILYLVSPLGLANFTGEAMKHSLTRMYILEHPLMMILAVVLITIGYIKSKKQLDDTKKFKSLAIFYSLGLILILLRIPWQVWF